MGINTHTMGYGFRNPNPYLHPWPYTYAFPYICVTCLYTHTLGRDVGVSMGMGADVSTATQGYTCVVVYMILME